MITVEGGQAALHIIGRGMLARSFASADTHCVKATLFAAGVSDSLCRDPAQFLREKSRLHAALQAHLGAEPFIYFGTCSVTDPASEDRPYVIHKRAMEADVLAHPSGRVVRLPQVAGPDPAPNTLLAALCRAVRKQETIQVWRHATRNIIDSADVAALLGCLIARGAWPDRVVTIANPRSHRVPEIIAAIERVLELRARTVDVDLGAPYDIDVSAIQPLIAACDIRFDADYLDRTLRRYYL